MSRLSTSTAREGHASATEVTAPRLLDTIVEETVGQRREESGLLDSFLKEPTDVGALRIWRRHSGPVESCRQFVRVLNRDVAAIDALINTQVNAILHHDRFQRLEASWRGLDFLTRRAEDDGAEGVKIKLMHARWSDLERDFDRAIEFDQSELFRKIYEEQFGTPGGEPFGVLLGDYEVRPRPGAGHRHDDLSVLESVAGVAAAAFCPFLTNVSPSMFGLDDFVGLEHTLDHARTMDQVDYVKWQALREQEDARFVGLAMPRVLMRLPYEADPTRVDGFQFVEETGGPSPAKYLWGGAAFALGSVIVRSFAEAEWPADIRGVERGVATGGLVTGLPVHEHGTDGPEIAQKATTDVVITDQLEKQLADLGFIPLCDCPDTPQAAFYSAPSIQKPKLYDRSVAQANARISSMIQYMLCVSRFAHYIKVMGRDRVGGVTRPDEFERILQDWLTRYVLLDDDAPPERKARFPLREAKVQIVPKPGASGSYRCVIHLVPHYQLDDMAVKVRLSTEISPPKAR